MLTVIEMPNYANAKNIYLYQHSENDITFCIVLKSCIFSPKLIPYS